MNAHQGEKAHYSRDLALMQLETALRLYAEGRDRDYASVITLAGASDEIFGQFLAAAGGENALESIKRSVVAISERYYGESLTEQEIRAIVTRANYARDRLKHWNKKRADPEIVKLNLPVEAADMLNRAIDNYWALEARLTEPMERFQREYMERERLAQGASA